MRNENDFIRYLELLKEFAKRYTVIVVSHDTPCGQYFTNEYSIKLLNMGFNIDLSNMYRKAYVGIVDEGYIIYEKCNDDKIEDTLNISGNIIHFRSVGFKDLGLASEISINGNKISSCGRGLNFLLYEKIAGEVLDIITFDTYHYGFPCSHSFFCCMQFIKKHNDITLVGFNFPAFPKDNENKTNNGHL